MARKIHFYLGFGTIRDHLFKRLELSMDRGNVYLMKLDRFNI